MGWWVVQAAWFARARLGLRQLSRLSSAPRTSPPLPDSPHPPTPSLCLSSPSHTHSPSLSSRRSRRVVQVVQAAADCSLQSAVASVVWSSPRSAHIISVPTEWHGLALRTATARPQAHLSQPQLRKESSTPNPKLRLPARVQLVQPAAALQGGQGAASISPDPACGSSLSGTHRGLTETTTDRGQQSSERGTCHATLYLRKLYTLT